MIDLILTNTLVLLNTYNIDWTRHFFIDEPYPYWLWFLQNAIMVTVSILYVELVLFIVKLYHRIKLNQTRTLSEANDVRTSFDDRNTLFLIGVSLTAPLVISLAILNRCHQLNTVTFIYSTLCASILIIPTIVFVIKFPNIQTLSFRDVFHKDVSYSLFLRAFMKDDYARPSLIQFKSNRFSEFFYTEHLKERVSHIFAVGNPKVLTSPYGAERVFLDFEDNQWKHQVKALMQEAEEIHILVCATESCLWEIQEALSLRDKLVLIVDDLKEYESIRSSIQVLPTIPKLRGKVFLLRYQNFKWSCSEYKDKRRRKRFDWTKVFTWFLILSFPITFLSFLPSTTTIASWTRESQAEYRKAYQWDCNQWIEYLSSHLPITVSESVQITNCTVQDSLVIFNIHGFQKPFVTDVDIKLVLDSLFSINPNIERLFYESLFQTFEIISLSFRDSISTQNTMLNEDDMIRLGRINRHIKKHQSVEEQISNYYETVPYILID